MSRLTNPAARVHAVVLSLGVFFANGCFDPRDPELRAFFSCEASAAFTITRGEERGQFECLIPEPWILVGLPDRKVGAPELTAAGVIPELASLLSAGDATRVGWCLAREAARGDVTRHEYETARSVCTTTSIVIRDVVYAPSGKIRLSLQRSEDGRPVLLALEHL